MVRVGFEALLLGAAVLSTTAAIPAPQNGFKTQDVVATFDDIPASPLVANLGGSEVGRYKSLNYYLFANQQPTEIKGKVETGIQPQSNPNYATTGPNTGTGVGTALLGTSNITSIYSGSKVLAFDLQSLYFGCFSGLANQAVLAPLSCTITVDGYRGSSKKVASKTFSFKAPALPQLKANMVKVTFPPEFKLIQTAVFNMGGPDIVPAYDNISYKTYNITG